MNKPYIYTETAFHHEGDLGFLKKLIDASARAGAHGVKFQVLIDFNELIASTNPAYDKLQSYTFTPEQWADVFRYTIASGMEIIVMPLDAKSFELIRLFKTSVRYLELHSVSYYDAALKDHIRASGIDLILGAGGRSLQELHEAKDYFQHQLSAFMVGFQSFPSRIEDIRIRRIQELKAVFPSINIGYADHSAFDDKWAVKSNEIAYLLGATMFEKHITVAEGEKRVDFDSAVSAEKIKQISDDLNALYTIVNGYPDAFEMTSAEMVYRKRQKVFVASHNLSAGTKVLENDIALKMTGSSEGLVNREKIVGKILKRNIGTDELILEDDVS